MTGDFDPEEFEDEYQVQLRQLVEAKLEEGEAVDTAATFGEGDSEPEHGKVIDLMDALRRSIDRGAATTPAEEEAAAEEEGTAKKTDSKQSSAQKTTEKKTAPKKSAAKKSAAKKTTAKKPAAKKTQKRKGA